MHFVYYMHVCGVYVCMYVCMCVKYVYMCSVSAVYVCGLCMHVWCVWRMSLCMLWCVCGVHVCCAIHTGRHCVEWHSESCSNMSLCPS